MTIRSFTLTIALALLVGVALLAPPSSVAARPPAVGMGQADDERCFPETGFCISGRIRSFWEQNGGLPVFGFPIGPQGPERVEGRVLQVQQFERHRLELHPENAFPYDVLLGRLGAEQQQQLRIPSLPEQRQAGCLHFEQTRHTVCGFAQAWRSSGLEFDGQPGSSFEESLALFGLPVSAVMTLTLSDGRPYQVQFFERARFEYHPENQPPFDVLLGRLNAEARANTLPQRPQTLLPAPLFFLYDNMIFRLERDGLTQVPLADERGNGTITAFSTAPGTHALAYVLETPDGYRLRVADASGANRRELHRSTQLLRNPIWSPDGARLAFYQGTFEGRAPGGIFTVPSAGGPVEPLASDDLGAAPIISFLPESWSPSGDFILVTAVGRQTSGCFPRALAVGRRLVRDLPSPDGRRLACGGAWTADGELLVSVIPEEDALSGAGLWRVNMATSTVTPFVAERTDFGYNLPAHVRALPDGSLRAFVAQARELPRLGSPVALAYTPNTVQPDGSTLRGRDFEVYAAEELAEWAPDGSGFLLRGPFGDTIGRVKTVWVPADGGAPFEINNPGERFSWGS